jgi:hypothetical protein
MEPGWPMHDQSTGAIGEVGREVAAGRPGGELGRKSKAMRSLSSSPDPALPALHLLVLILAGVAAPVWGVAGLTVSLSLLIPGVLVLALSAFLGLVSAPFVLACRSWPDGRRGWLYWPDSLLEARSWLYRCWLRWPWLCWKWLSQPRDQESRFCFKKLRQSEFP